MLTNFFGFPIYGIPEILADPIVERMIRDRLYFIFTGLCVPTKRVGSLVDTCISEGKREQDIAAYEQQVHNAMIVSGADLTVLPIHLDQRARQVRDQLLPHIQGKRVFDFGCGTGRVGELIAERGYDVTLGDIEGVYRDPIQSNGLESRTINLDGKATHTRKGEFDTALLVTILHHSTNPFITLKEAHRITKPNVSGRVLVIESTYDVTGAELSDEDCAACQDYVSLSSLQQYKALTYFDHFANRFYHFTPDPAKKPCVPYNHTTPEGWKNIFASSGFRQESITHLGIDLPMFPEYHTLHILRKDQ